MALGTFSDLKTSVADWLDRADLTNQIVDFIALTEAQINRTLRIRSMETSSDITINAGTVALPTGFRAAKTFFIDRDPRQQLVYLPVHRLNEGGLASNVTALPRYFTYEGDSFKFRPEPDTSYTGKLIYWKAFTALSDANPTNSLLTNNPDIYLYGTLMQANIFLQDDKEVSKYAALFTTAMQNLQSEDDKNRISGSEKTPRARSRTP